MNLTMNLTIRKIKEAVADAFEINEECLDGMDKAGRLGMARQAALAICYTLRKELFHNETNICRAFGRRNNGAAKLAAEKVEFLRKTDREFGERFLLACKTIREAGE